MANINIGINVVWDNQKQMQQAKADLLSLGKSALLSADNFGTTGTEINKAFSNMLPSIKTSTQALKVFTTDGYLAWTKYQKEVDEATKGQQKALSTQVKNMSAGFDKMSKAPDATISSMKKYLKTIQGVQAEYDRVAKLNKTATASFSSTSFLKTIEKQKKATAEWGSEFVAVSQAMDAISKKGATLELGNASGKQTENIKALRDEYNSLQAQLNKMDVSKFNKAMQTQYSYTESTKGVLEALKEKYKTLDVAIKGMISSGDTKNLESYKQKLLSVKNTITKLQDASEQFNKEGFFSTLDKNSEAIEAMDGRLAAVNARMKMLRTTILKFTDSGKASEAELKELRAEYAKLSVEQKSLQKSTDGTATRIKNLIKSFVSAQAIVWLVRTVFTKFIETLKEASQAAAAAEETMNLFDVVFENVGDEAEEMAGKMSKSFGVAKSSIAEGLSTLGDFAEGLGMSNQNALDFANTLSSRMLDVISFKNVTGDTTDILKNLASGLAGNTENFRTWGIVIKESSVKLWLAKNNMDKLTGTALELAKVQARAALFMEQSTNAAGDMARTFDSTTNIARRLTEANKQLNENIGVGINEIVTPVKKGLLGIVTSWNNATAAKKAYAEIDAFENDTKPQDNSQNKELVYDFLREMYKKPKEPSLLVQAYHPETTVSETGAYIPDEKIVSLINDQGINLKEFNAMVKLLGGSIDDTLSVFKDLGVEVNSNVVWYAKLAELARERAKLEGEQLQSLKDFNETVASWSSTDTSGVFKPVAQALSDIITPFESATGTQQSATKLAQSYQAELKTEFETAYNNLIQAQKDGNKGLAEKAQSTLDTITKQYKSAQSIIDQEAQNAKDQADSAKALSDAVSAFKSAMSGIVANIATMNSNISEMMRNAGVSASMLGSDSSMVSIEQNRQTALLGVRNQNQQAQQTFAKKNNVDLVKYNYLATSKAAGFSIPKNIESSDSFKEYEALLKAQSESLKKTNTYYDLLASNAKVQLAYSDAQLNVSAETIKNYKELSNDTLSELKLKVESGEITQKYYDDEKKILGEHLATLGSMDFKKLKESLESLSDIKTTGSLTIGGSGLYAGATKTYKENLSQLGEIKAKVIADSNSGIMSDKDADMLAEKLSDIKKSYELDKDQAFLDATGISTGADAQLITNISSILKDSKIESAVKDIGKSITGLFSQGNEDGEGKGALSGITESIKSLFSEGDDDGKNKGVFSGVSKMFDNVKDSLGSFGAAIAPLGKVLVYILSKTESFQKLLSIITDALDELAPIIDSFLQPLMLVLDPLVTLLKNTLIPLLEILFPIIKAFMFILLPLIATINTLHVYMNALGATIKDIVTFNWGGIGDNWKNAAKKTGQIWDETNDQLEELKNMTLDTTEGLTEANSDYVDAVNDMLTNGLLTGQEALQMIASEAGTSYTGNNYRYMDSDSYNKGAGTVNIGTVTIDAKGKTMEEITEELRQMSYENSVTGGVSY